MTRNNIQRPAWALLALLACAGIANAAPLSKTELNDAVARHRAEVARCMSGQSTQDRNDCIADADGALRNAKRGDLDAGADSIVRNRKLRCEPLPAELRKDCLARMDGAGSVSGSVAAGGLYRELVTIQVDPQPDPPQPGNTAPK